MPQSDLDFHFQKLRSVLVGHAMTYCQDRDEAQDIAMDVYLAARDSLQSYRGAHDPVPIRAWLLGICSHLALQSRRSASIRQRAVLRMLESLQGESAKVSRGDLYDALIWRIRTSSLTPRQAESVRLHMDGHSFKAISRRMGISASTVQQHVQGAIVKMRAAHAGELEAPDLDHHAMAGQRVTRYFKPTPTGSALAREKLSRLR